ncbi:2-dehydropantoate 2-reductase N-terminal domain-containing protein, partial [Poseidonibacter lekithochrous]
MQWHILGAGAIGCLWAHCLIKAKQDVRIILRNKAHLHTYKATSGLHY